jgi:hypothetical protein
MFPKPMVVIFIRVRTREQPDYPRGRQDNRIATPSRPEGDSYAGEAKFARTCWAQKEGARGGTMGFPHAQPV